MNEEEDVRRLMVHLPRVQDFEIIVKESLRIGGGGGGGSAGGKEHSAEEFQAWITKMRGGNPKSEEVDDAPNEDNQQNGASIGDTHINDN